MRAGHSGKPGRKVEKALASLSVRSSKLCTVVVPRDPVGHPDTHLPEPTVLQVLPLLLPPLTALPVRTEQKSRADPGFYNEMPTVPLRNSM